MSVRAEHSLPALRTDAHGQRHVDWRAMLALAVPLAMNSATQTALNLIDTWFVGRISTQALAGMGAIQWLVIVFIALLGGVGMAVQTLVAQAHGGRRYARAGQATWTALWAAMLTAPVFFIIGFNGRALLAPAGIDAAVLDLAIQFWQPRMLGAPLGVAIWALLGFYNGIGRPRVTLVVNVMMLVINALLDWLFVIHWNMGMAGAAYATNYAMACGLGLALYLFLFTPDLQRYRQRLMWRLHVDRLLIQLKLGLPMGVMLAADVFGFALFQLMQVKLGAVDGAATQIAMMLTSIAYMPAVGIALAGTTLVGHSIGAGDRDWAQKMGNATILLAMTYMGGIGLLLAVGGPWLMPWFVASSDPLANEVIRTGVVILWLAGAYQLFDGMTLGASLCLRGAGDAIVPAAMFITLSWLFFVPLAHALAFAPGQGWVDFLPQFGFGTIGGWAAAVIYVCIIGCSMVLRWRSGAWKKIRLR